GLIKVYENLSRESYYAIADEAKKLKIPFAGHVPNSITPVEASNTGQKSIEHLTRMLIACSSKEDKFKVIKNEEWTPSLRMEMLESFSELKCREVAAVFVSNGTWHNPTNVVNRNGLSDDESFTKDARLRYVPAHIAQSWIKFSERYKPSNRKNREFWFQRLLEVVKILNQSGVSLLAGTDVGNPFIYAGFSLHDELELFVQAGLTPMHALETATINPAKYLGMEKSLGTIERGKLADLVLLDANPLSDISNTRKINAVVANGKYLSREFLNKMLSDVEVWAKRQ
ncbi:MAG: amidohydrolase family protein, partial [Acidobacteria bacterium]|nr:amidohydrolase family protein [Acidobacteriota bacterium]